MNIVAWVIVCVTVIMAVPLWTIARALERIADHLAVIRARTPEIER